MLSKQPDFLNGRDPTGKKINVLMAKLLVADSDIRKMLNIFTSLMARMRAKISSNGLSGKP